MDSNNQDFSSTVLTAVAKKREWFDTVLLPKVQDNYRLHLTCVNTIIEALVKKSLINPDPYKKDKKISSIVLPDDHNFNENERPTQLGIRLSDYQSMLDYICNYMKFTVEQLNTEKIRKLPYSAGTPFHQTLLKSTPAAFSSAFPRQRQIHSPYRPQ